MVRGWEFLTFFVASPDNESLKKIPFMSSVTRYWASSYGCPPLRILRDVGCGDVLSILKLGVFENLHVLLRKIINDTDKIRSQYCSFRM